MARPDPRLAEALAPYVCVRVTDMKGVDFETFDFDFDLTYAVLLMHANGEILHTYAGRDHTRPESHQSPKTFATVLDRARAKHKAVRVGMRKPRAGRSVEQLPWMKRRPKQPDCYHCHNVHDALLGEKRHKGTFQRQDAWRWPDPRQIGIEVDRQDQTRLTAVFPRSPAAAAGLRAGDRITSLGGEHVLTFGDIQRVLHRTAPTAGRLEVAYARRGEGETGRVGTVELALPAGWKRPTPLVYSWRPTKWALIPKPGFGGRPLGADQKKALGIEPDAFAFRIGYLVTWGESAHTGRNAVAAGLWKKDVVVSVAGKDDFRSMDHFHAWFRLTQVPGTSVPVVYIRDGTRHTTQLKVLK